MAFGMTPSEINDFMKDIGQEGNKVLGEYLTTEKIVPPPPEDAHKYPKKVEEDDRLTESSDEEVKTEVQAEHDKAFWREVRGDYFDVRDYLRAETMKDKLKFLKNKRNDQIMLLREHLLMQMAFNPQFRREMVREVNIITKLLAELRENDPPPKPREVIPKPTNFTLG